jgi:hypothetical protein
MWWNRKDDTEVAELKGIAVELKRAISDLKIEKRAAEQERKLSKEVTGLREELETLRIEKLRVTEEHEKEKREVKHMVGLERKRSEFERTAAEREARVKVREENLDADRKRFEEQMDWSHKQIKGEMERFEGLLQKLLERLPTVKWEATTEHNGNGKKATSDA